MRKKLRVWQRIWGPPGFESIGSVSCVERASERLVRCRSCWMAASRSMLAAEAGHLLRARLALGASGSDHAAGSRVSPAGRPRRCVRGAGPGTEHGRRGPGQDARTVLRIGSTVASDSSPSDSTASGAIDPDRRLLPPTTANSMPTTRDAPRRANSSAKPPSRRPKSTIDLPADRVGQPPGDGEVVVANAGPPSPAGGSGVTSPSKPISMRSVVPLP